MKFIFPNVDGYPRYNDICGCLKSINKPLADWRDLDDLLHEFPINCENLIRCNPNTGFLAMKLWNQKDG